MQINFSDPDELKTLRDLCEKERQRLSDWIEEMADDNLVDKSIILRRKHITKMIYAIGALYGEVLFPTEKDEK